MREMKDSGISWIGLIPKGWNIYRNKNAFSCSKELVGKKFKETQLLSLTTKGIKLKDINNPEGKLPESFDTYQYVKKDEIVMCLFDLDCSAVFSGRSPYDGMISPAYKVLTCTTKMVPAYADYWFTYISYDRKFNHYAKNIRYTLNYEEFASLPMLFPSVEEQHRIADYLDKKCAKIDAIIEKQQEIIEKLKEYKISVITETVTKGITTSAVLKKCEVPGVETIPESWEVKKLKHFTEVISKGTTPSTVGRDINDEGPVRFFKAENIQNNRVCKKPEFFIDEETNDFLNRSQLTDRDILFVIAGATIGKTAIISDDCLPANTNQAVSFIRINDKRNRKYVWYSLQSLHMKTMLAVKATQAAQPNLAMEDLGNYPIFLPTKAEMERIIDYLDKKCDVIDETIISKSRIIEKFQEYKQSLIYEAVTGKREV
ncbi:type I restriction enzyme, S subunit [[Clostridium] aminophilum]|uniref:Type I restriction enzyme, S subunit n=1 Tax=[Clostridium] aminophilum TaxID=1526 RepID=A0A1I0FN96_9FIRM|nr:restriction endonuclease subunit S [[Clostridium] aminophilum]SET59827.1 type I restriction enzyme, S subunit [[Clostridium] aminophilum]